MYRTLIILTFIISSISCKAQDTLMTSVHETPPYLIERDDVFYQLPKSLSIKKGFTAVTIYLSKDGQINDFAIKKLQAFNEDGSQRVDFISEDFKPKTKSKYPKVVSEFYKPIKNYLVNLEIIRNEKYVGKMKESQVSFLIRFH